MLLRCPDYRIHLRGPAQLPPTPDLASGACGSRLSGQIWGAHITCIAFWIPMNYFISSTSRCVQVSPWHSRPALCQKTPATTTPGSDRGPVSCRLAFRRSPSFLLSRLSRANLERRTIGATKSPQTSGQAADALQIFLRAPYCRACQRRLCGGGTVKREQESGNGPAVVVDDDGQPGARDLPLSRLPKIQLGVIGLPYLVGSHGFSAVDQIERSRYLSSPSMASVFKACGKPWICVHSGKSRRPSPRASATRHSSR